MKTLNISMKLGAQLFALAGIVTLTSCLTGCGMNGNGAGTGSGTTGLTQATSQGRVIGGQNPVSGSTISLYATTTGGYGIGSANLLTSTVTSDGGYFTISGKYTCPTPVANLYIVATGGNPGIGGAVSNPYIALMAALGPCPAGGNLATAYPFIQINEETTVAAVFALQQFMAPPASANFLTPGIGAPSTTYSTTAGSPTPGAVASAVIGMNNAFTTAKVLADVTTGYSPNSNYSYATPEYLKIGTIADILSYCVNSNPYTDNACTQLFNLATPAGAGYTASDTIQAAWYIAQNPANNVAALFGLVNAAPPFPPTTSTPKDYTVAINYAPTTSSSTNAISGAYGVAIDAFGNAWLANSTGSSVVELGTDGSLIMQPVTSFSVNGFGGSYSQFTTAPTLTRTVTTPKYVAIDLNNQAWVTNEGDVATGTPTAGTATSTGDVAVFTGSTAAGTGGTGGGAVSGGYFVGGYPWSLAVDGSNNVWVVNSGSATTSLDYASISKMTNTGSSYVYSTSASTSAPNRVSGGSAGAATFIAIDNNSAVPGGIIWVENPQGCAMSGKYGSSSTKWGSFNEFQGSTDTSLTGSEAVTSWSTATVGAGVSGGNCGSTSTYVGQLVGTAPSTVTVGPNGVLNATGGTATPSGIAVDRYNNVYINNEDTSLTGFDGITMWVAPSALSGLISTAWTTIDINTTPPTPGIAPSASGTTLRKGSVLAVDGNNNLWATGLTNASVAELNINPTNGATTFYTPGYNAATTATGFVHSLGVDYGIAIDPSGNVWVTSTSGTYTSYTGATLSNTNSVTVIVGAAGPVITPMSLALAKGMLGTKP